MRFSIPLMSVADDAAALASSTPLAEQAANQKEQRMNEAAFQSLYQQVAPKLRGYLRRAASDVALADDIFQEAFLRFLRVSPAGLDERQQTAYLYRTATALLVDHWRRARRERLWSLLRPFQEATTDRVAMGKDMRATFARLKPQEQALLWLAYVEGFDHREIAAALELRERSVRVLLFRARKRLAGLLTAAGLGPP